MNNFFSSFINVKNGQKRKNRARLENMKMDLIFSIILLIVCPLIQSKNFNLKEPSYGTKQNPNSMDSYQLVGGKLHSSDSVTCDDGNFLSLFVRNTTRLIWVFAFHLLYILNIENVELVNNVEQKACVQSCVYFRHLLKAFASPTFNKPYPSSSHWKINYFEVYEMSFTKYKIPEKRYPFFVWWPSRKINIS